jgi:hypothetical protein
MKHITAILLVFCIAGCVRQSVTQQPVLKAASTEQQAIEPVKPVQKLVYRKLYIDHSKDPYRHRELESERRAELSGQARSLAYMETANALVLWLCPVNLSRASEIRIRLRITNKAMKPYLMFRGLNPTRTSPKVYMTPYLERGQAHIPIAEFKAAGWNLENVCMAYIGCDYQKSVTGRMYTGILCAGFLRTPKKP